MTTTTAPTHTGPSRSAGPGRHVEPTTGGGSLLTHARVLARRAERRDQEREVVGGAARLAGAFENDGLAQVEGGQERGQDTALVANRRQLDERGAAAVGGLPRPADLGGQAGLAGTTGADHRRQPAAGEHPDDTLRLGLAPEEAGQPGAQAGTSADGGLDARHVLAEQRDVELA